MATGTLEFAAPIAGVRFEPIDVNVPHAAVEKVVLQTENDERLKITFHLIDVFTFEGAEAIAARILPSIINRLAFYRNVSVGEPYQIGGTLPKDPSDSLHTVRRDLLLLWDEAIPILTLGDDMREELARQLEQPYTHHDLYSLYRFASGQSDELARFMFFYNILLQLHNDIQRQVDAFILQERPDVPQSPSPRSQGRNETVYTRLRNEVGHRRAGTTPEQTRREIQENIAAFQELVRTAISRVV